MSNKYPGGIITSGANAGYSVAFDGNGDELNAGSNSAFAFGTGAYTVEFWAYLNVAVSATHMPCFVFNDTTGGWGIYNENGTNQLQIATRATAGAVLGSSTTLSALTWNHVVAVRSGTSSNQTSIFVNGVRVANGTDATNWTITGPCKLGGISSANYYLNGYLSNVRIVKGTAVYDPTQTTLRTPTQLFNITNTSLLTCNSPAIVDQSTNAFTITASGDAKVSTFTPFQGYVQYNPALGAATPGVWTVTDALQAAQTRRWNMYDPYFNLTTLYLPGNGTNGAQNNTFLDSSSNNFTITRNGNTTQGTFSPFSQTGWGNYFNGSSYLSAPASSAFAFGTGNLTVEMWLYITAYPGSTSSDYFCPATNRPYNAGDSTTWMTIVYGDGTFKFSDSVGTQQLTTTATIPLNKWTHVAVVRSSTSTNGTTIYFNGVAVAQGTNSINFSSTSNTMVMGWANDNTAGRYLTGYMSNLRIVKGSAVYTANFTPPTEPLTAVTNTQLLTCQSNRFIDNSSNAFAITVNGTPSVQAFSPFLTNVAYTPTNQGGSGYFDGTGDYLTCTPGAIGTSDFIMECWVYLSSTTQKAILDARSGTNTNGTAIHVNGSSQFQMADGTSYIGTASSTVVINQWYYLVMSRTGGNQRLFVNGVSTGTTANSTNYSTNSLKIGAAGDNSINYAGYISGIKLTIGSGVTSVTVPTVPPSPTGAALCTNFTNAGIVDMTAKNVLETVGNAQISTTQSKWGGSSVSVTGSTGYGVMRANELFAMPGDFTIEAWIYRTTSGAEGYILSCDKNNYLQFGITAAGKLEANQGGVGVLIAGTTTLATNTWYHVAMTRASGTVRLFVNGTQEASTTYTTSVTGLTNPIGVGTLTTATSLYPFTGYIDDLRFTQGYARYTANFTPPTSALQTQ